MARTLLFLSTLILTAASAIGCSNNKGGGSGRARVIDQKELNRQYDIQDSQRKQINTKFSLQNPNFFGQQASRLSKEELSTLSKQLASYVSVSQRIKAAHDQNDDLEERADYENELVIAKQAQSAVNEALKAAGGRVASAAAGSSVNTRVGGSARQGFIGTPGSLSSAPSPSSSCPNQITQKPGESVAQTCARLSQQCSRQFVLKSELSDSGQNVSVCEPQD